MRLDGEDQLSLALRFDSPARAHLAEQRIIRVSWPDGAFDEWRITKIARRRGEGLTGTVECAPILHDLATRGGLVGRVEADGSAFHDFELLGQLPSHLVEEVIAPAAPAYCVPGTITPTAALDASFDWDTPLSALRNLAALTKSELALRRNGTTDYRIDLVAAIGAAAAARHVLLGRDLMDLVRESDSDEQVTRIYPRGGGEEGAARTLSRARWRVSAVSTDTHIELQDPNGGDGPAQFADQLNGHYVRRVAGTLQAVTDTQIISAGTTRLLMASTTGFTVDDEVEIRRDSAGADVTALEDPAAIATYGAVTRLYDRPDIPPIRNLVTNPNLAGTFTSDVPAGFAKVGTPTASENADPLYTRVGGKSWRLQTTADGQGGETAAISVAPTEAEPYLSGYVRVFVRELTGAARIRVELVDVTNNVIWPDPVIRKAATTEVGVWLDIFGPPNGYDAFAAGCSSVKLRILQDGAGTADVYWDAAQLTPTADLQEYFAGDGAVALWQAANEELALRSAPRVGLTLSALDLARWEPSRWPGEAFTLGGTVHVRDAQLGITISTRVVARRRNLMEPGSTEIDVSNRPEDLLDRLLPAWSKRSRVHRWTKEADPYRDHRVSLGTPDVEAADTSILVTVTPSPSVAFWRLHLRQGATLPADAISDANLIGERKHDTGAPNYDNILATGLMQGTQYAWRVVPYNRDGVRVPEAEVSDDETTTGTAPWSLSGFTVTGTGSGASSVDELRWSHNTGAMPAGHTLDILRDDGGGVYEDLVLGRDPRMDADGSDAIDASGDGGYDVAVEVGGSVLRTWFYRLRLKNSLGQVVEQHTAQIARLYGVAVPGLVSADASSNVNELCDSDYEITISWVAQHAPDGDFTIDIESDINGSIATGLDPSDAFFLEDRGTGWRDGTETTETFTIKLIRVSDSEVVATRQAVQQYEDCNPV